MSRDGMYYFRSGHSPHEENVDGAGITEARLDDNFLSIVKCAENAELYVSASRSYISASRRAIDDLKEHLLKAEADMSTAEECILESEGKLKTLKSELHILFKKSFYQNIDSQPDETLEKKSSIRATPLDKSSSLDNALGYLEKHAEESNLDLKDYKISLQLQNGLKFELFKRADNKYSVNQINKASSGSSVQDETLNSTLNNDLQIKESETSLHETDFQDNFSKVEDGMLNNDTGCQVSFSNTFVKEINMPHSAKKDECEVSLTKEVIDGCNEGMFGNYCSGYASSSMNLVQMPSGPGQMSEGNASGFQALQSDKGVQTEPSQKIEKFIENHWTMVNKGNRSKSQNECNSDESFFKSTELHNKRNPEDILSSKVLQDDTFGHSSDQQDEFVSTKKSTNKKIHSNDVTECGTETKRNRNKHKRSENHKIQIENRNKMSSKSTCERPSELFLGRSNAAYSNRDAKNGGNSTRISPSTGSFYVKNSSPILTPLSKQGCKITLPKSSSENNLSRLPSCRPKSLSIKGMKLCSKNESCLTDEISNTEQPENSFSNKRANCDKTILHLKKISSIPSASTQGTKQSSSRKESRKISGMLDVSGNRINLSKKQPSPSKKVFLTPQLENRRLARRRKEDFLEKKSNPLFNTPYLRDLPSNHNTSLTRGCREINTSDISVRCSISGVGKNVDRSPIFGDQARDNSQNFSTISSQIPTDASHTEEVFYPVNKTNIFEYTDNLSLTEDDSDSLDPMEDNSNISSERRAYGADSRDLPNEDFLSTIEPELSVSTPAHASDVCNNRSESLPSLWQDLPNFPDNADDRNSKESFLTARDSRAEMSRGSFYDRSFSLRSSGESDSTNRAFPIIPITSCNTSNGTIPLPSPENIRSFRRKFDSCSSPTPDYSP